MAETTYQEERAGTEDGVLSLRRSPAQARIEGA